ncbi:MAG: DeoR/GlpR family DNA-binding transcription regulator [Oscillospiraceae bacterium]|nr:DeoR/GlpR family DNA-binding transcription regulator [Oscillospiraceae bacterium]
MQGILPDVSLMTIHRDLTWLQEQGLAIKIRGGARSLQGGGSEPVFAAREALGRGAKLIIAEKAVSLLSGTGSIFLDAGTTGLALARQMPDMPASVVTSGPNIALELCRNTSMTVTLSGGVLHTSNLYLTGSAAVEALGKLNIGIAFLVPAGFSACAGFSCGRENEAAVKRLVTSKARIKVILMDTTKLDRVFAHTFAAAGDIDYVVTEKKPEELPEALREELRGAKII